MTEIHLTQGQRIRLAREEKGLEQEELAALAHIGRSTISNWENDLNKREVSFNHLKAIADATGKPVEFFMGKTAVFTSALTGGYVHTVDDDQLVLPIAA